MSILRPAVLAALILAAAAPATAAPTAPPASGKPGAPHQDSAKKIACEKVWAAQKVRHGSHAAFVAACVAKG